MTQDERIGKTVCYVKRGKGFVGIIRDVRIPAEGEPAVASIEVPGWGYHTVPCHQIVQEV